MTKENQIYDALHQQKGERVSILTLHNISNCMCIGAVCANLRKKGCVIENKEERQKGGIVHSWYKMISGCEKYSN